MEKSSMRKKLVSVWIVLVFVMGGFGGILIAEDTENVPVRSKIQVRDTTEKQSDDSILDGSRAPARSSQDDAHGGSWVDSFEDDSEIEWGMSDHLWVDDGNAKINGDYGLDPNAVGVWHFDEGSGTTTFDATSNGNDGTLQNGVSWTTLGKYGSALSFDGVDDYVYVPGDSSLDITAAITISAWVYPTAGSYNRGIVNKWDSTNSYYFNIINNDKLYIYINGFVTDQFSGVSVIPMNEWTYVAMSFDGNTQKLCLYVNGNLDNSATTSATSINSATEEITIGALEDAGIFEFFFQGKIDEVTILDYAISSQEIKDIYQNGSNRNLKQANLTSSSINLPPSMHWDTLIVDKSEPESTYINITVLDALTNQPIPGSPTYTDNGEVDISYIDSVQYPSVKLNATFEGDGSTTPELHYWAVSWNRSNTWQDTLFGGEKVESAENVEVVDGDVQLESGGLDDSTVAMWHFDEGSGTTVYDETDNENDGSINGASWATGKYGKALSFDGADDSVNINNQNQSLSGLEEITICAWICPNITMGNNIIVSKWVFSSNREWNLMAASDDLFWYVSTVGGGTDLSGIFVRDIISDGKWIYIAATWNGTEMKLYKNGTELVKDGNTGPGVPSGNINSAAAPVFIGADVNSNFKGIIDDVTIYNRALKPHEIKALYQNDTRTYKFYGTVTSKPIQLPTNMYWGNLIINKTEPQDTSLNVTILDGTTDQPIPNFENLGGTIFDVSSINPHVHTSIKLKAEFDSNGIDTHILHDWSVNFTENTAPNILDLISPSEIGRAISAMLDIDLFDLEDSEESLTLDVEYKSPSDTIWQTGFITETFYTTENWVCNFTPALDAEIGDYSFRVAVNDSFQYLDTTEYPDLIRVVNNKPNAPVVSISPVEPKTTDNLIVTAKNSTDIETSSNNLEYWYQWYMNDTHISDFDNETVIPSPNIHKHEAWRCVVYPFDGDEPGFPGEAQVMILNSPPELMESFTSLEMFEDTPTILEEKFFNMFADPDSDTLTFTATGQHNVEVEINQDNGTVTLIPAENWFGTEEITFYANDTFSPAASETVQVTVKPTNDLPRIIQMGNQLVSDDQTDLGFLVKQNELLPLSIIVNDADGDVERGMIQFIFNKSESTNFYFQNNESKLIFQPTNADVGYNYINISITDNNETPPKFMSYDILIEVLNVNDPPSVDIISPLPGKEFKRTDVITLFCIPEDPDLLIQQSNERITFEWFTNRTSAETLGTEQEINLTDHGLLPGYHNITVMVRDASGETATDSVDIIIQGGPAFSSDSDSDKDSASNSVWLWVGVILIIVVVMLILIFFLVIKKEESKPKDVTQPQVTYTQAVQVTIQKPTQPKVVSPVTMTPSVSPPTMASIPSSSPVVEPPLTPVPEPQLLPSGEKPQGVDVGAEKNVTQLDETEGQSKKDNDELFGKF